MRGDLYMAKASSTSPWRTTIRQSRCLRRRRKSRNRSSSRRRRHRSTISLPTMSTTSALWRDEAASNQPPPTITARRCASQDAQGYWRRAAAYRLRAARPGDPRFQQGGASSPDGVVHAQRGLALNRKGDFDRAIADYDKAIALQANQRRIQWPRSGLARQGRSRPRASPISTTRSRKAPLPFTATITALLSSGSAKYGSDREYDKAIDIARCDKRPSFRLLRPPRRRAWRQGRLAEGAGGVSDALPLNSSMPKAPAGRNAARLALTTASRQPDPAASAAPQVAAATAPSPTSRRERAVNERRVALVIGNSAYRNVPPLPIPCRDATPVRTRCAAPASRP